MSNLDDAEAALTQLQSNEQADQTQVGAALEAVQAAKNEATQSSGDPVTSAVISALEAQGYTVTAPNAGAGDTGTTTTTSTDTTDTSASA